MGAPSRRTGGAHLDKADLTRHGNNGVFEEHFGIPQETVEAPEEFEIDLTEELLKRLRLPLLSAGRAPMRPFGEARSRRSG